MMDNSFWRIWELLKEPKFMWCISDHSVLPWNRPCQRVEVELEILSLLLGHDCCSIATNQVVHILHVWTISPFSWDNMMLVIFLVQESILKARVPHMHQVMETHTCQNSRLHRLWLLSLRTQQTLETICKYAKRILHNSSAMRQPIVEDPLLVSHVTLRKGLHQLGLQSKCIVSKNKVGHRPVIFRKCIFWGKPNRSVFWLKICVSDEDLFWPTSTYRNL